MAFSASLCAATHNRSKKFIDPCGRANTGILAECIPSKRASIHHSFRFSFFHVSPNSSRARCIPLQRKIRLIRGLHKALCQRSQKCRLRFCQLFNAKYLISFEYGRHRLDEMRKAAYATYNAARYRGVGHLISLPKTLIVAYSIKG
jgi:hypothetical protein